MSDFKEYKNDRDFEIDLSELPYPIANNLNELNEIITTFDEQNYRSDLSLFLKKLGIKEKGKASQLIVEEIKKELNK